MRRLLCSKSHCHVKRVGMFVIVAALIAGMAGCAEPPPKDREIWNWHDLDAVRRRPRDRHRLMRHLDATTAGYEELASPRANRGKGWAPIRFGGFVTFWGTFDGQGYEIRDLFINRPDESGVGLFGSSLAGKIRNLGVVNASVTGKHQVGGLLGDSLKTDVYNSYFSGNATGSKNVGGLVGILALAMVSNSYATGSVSGAQYVGGVVGQNVGDVINSYSVASVSGDQYVGGLVGNNTLGLVSNSYSTGSVAGDRNVGGLVGTGGDVRSSFWDVETSGQTTSATGTGKTTAEMKNIATFMGWDICAVADPNERNPACIWNIVDGETYPVLSWQPTR